MANKNDKRSETRIVPGKLIQNPGWALFSSDKRSGVFTDEGLEIHVAFSLDQLTQRTWVLDLREQELTVFPAQIGAYPELRIVWLDQNNLRELGGEIGQLNRLTHLFLADNQLEQFPEEIGDLDLDHNQLGTLPAGFGRLPRLSMLHLNANKFVEFPPVILRLIHLKELYLGKDFWTDYTCCTGNRIRELPSGIGRLNKLSVLYLSGNPIQNVPPAVSRLIE